jgi:hypothetical protein
MQLQTLFRKRKRKPKQALLYDVENPIAFDYSIQALNELIRESEVYRLPYSYKAYSPHRASWLFPVRSRRSQHCPDASL